VLVTAFSTNDDFAARFGEDLSDLEMTRVDALLARLRHHQGTPPARRFRWSKTTRSAGGTRDDRILLPERPVVSVASVTLNGLALAAEGAWFLDGDEIVRRATNTFFEGTIFVEPLSLPYIGFGWESETLKIVYTHGYADDAIPGTVKAICVEAAVRA
jgi:hypothetical protein